VLRVLAQADRASMRATRSRRSAGGTPAMNSG
jgi:hypothetical protein